jgi:hypothetical protein
MKLWPVVIVLVCVALAPVVYHFARTPRVVSQVQVPEQAPQFSATRQTVSTNAERAIAGEVARTDGVSASTTQSGQVKSASVVADPELPPNVLPEPDVPVEELPQLPASVVLENVRAVFRQYRSRMGGNPVGTNYEITRALNGENPRQARFLKMEDGMRVNAKGELVDIWGTPYFFHQLSADEMEIHSAGPDRRMWTGDDLTMK